MDINTPAYKKNFKEKEKEKEKNKNRLNNSGDSAGPKGYGNGDEDDTVVKPRSNFNSYDDGKFKNKKKRNKKPRYLNESPGGAGHENQENEKNFQANRIQAVTDVKAEIVAKLKNFEKSGKPGKNNKTPGGFQNKATSEFKNKNPKKKNKERKSAFKETADIYGKPEDIYYKLNKTEFESADDLRDYEPEDIESFETDADSVDSLKAKIIEQVDAGPAIEIVGIRFKPVGKIYFFSPNGETYLSNDKIIVETSRGLELGYVVIPNKNISASRVVQPLKPVIRRAKEEDVQKVEKNRQMAKETIKIANDRIKFHNLDSMKMKLIESEYTFDNSKLIYYFTADGRVDFRELVKDLAAIFKTRIEMRQIGIRDQTKILGGLSICGRPFCCNSFLQDFAQVTIKMAKEQNMSINSAKISGACGRLMCCLKYEHEAYDHLSKDTPKVNSIVEASTGETGTVIDSNILTGICKVRINQKSPDGDNTLKPYHKKNLKVIGFLKNEHERSSKNSEKDPEDLKDSEKDN